MYAMTESGVISIRSQAGTNHYKSGTTLGQVGTTLGQDFKHKVLKNDNLINLYILGQINVYIRNQQ
jgi:hypothetical protein